MYLWLSRCAASSAASCRGNPCRVSGAGMIVTMFRWFATLFLAPLGSSEGPSDELHCLLVWLGMIACDFLVTNNGFIYLAPGLQVSARLWMTYPASTRRIQVHSVLIHRCELQSRCVFQSVLPRLDRVSDFVSLEFSMHFESPRVLVWF